MKKRCSGFVLLACIAALISGCSDDNELTIAGSACNVTDCDPDYCGNICLELGIPSSGGVSLRQTTQDVDGDTVPDALDNCPMVINSDQKDSNDDGIGDACTIGDRDGDGDTIPDKQDNCPIVPNKDQTDSNNDGQGDACSMMIVDLDNDTIPDADDNCPKVANPNQEDADSNGVGDACELQPDVDTDGDGIPDKTDNCPDTPNADQADSNNDGIGDACTQAPPPKPDTDGDGIPDESDNCPNTPNPDQADSNNDGKGDACTDAPPKPDTDGDTIPDESDNCPGVANPDQKDSNNDGKGDACTQAPVQEDGSPDHPFTVKATCATTYRDSRDTKSSPNSLIDYYPKNTNTDETGSEYYYKVTIDKRSKISIWLDAEPEGVDIDIHLLRNLKISNKTVPDSDFIDRNDKSLSQIVDAGTYWIVADTYSGNAKAGKYTINIQIMPEYAGTKNDPILLNCGEPLPSDYVLADVRSTANATSSVYNTYPGETLSEAGPEYIYKFTLKEKARFHANIRKPEPANTDIDLYLLSSLDPKVISRSDSRIWQVLDPGTYYIVADSYNGLKGNYFLDIQTRPVGFASEHMFNDYILKAVNWLSSNYGKLGYNINTAYTHDLPYGSNAVPKGPYAPKTMCVAAVAETILVAMYLYAQETKDNSVWNHIPWRSWSSMRPGDMRSCMWVNHELKCEGSGDALALFGMGMNVPFEELTPGSFVNINRTGGSGHAVVFISFLDSNCKEYSTYNSNVVGFKYYSSQGGSDVGRGGFDYRYAVFSGKSMATCPNYHDTGVIRSDNPLYLNTGVMYMPKYWLKTTRAQGL